MTDKQNFARDIYVPSKEQIIIDGINVTDCKYIIDHDPPEWQGTWGGAIHKGACKIYSKDCKYNSNCDFKQLARKTHELEVICKAFDIEYAYDDDGKIYGRSNKLRSLQQECEQKDERIIELTKEYQKLKEEKDKVDKAISDLIGCVSLLKEFTQETKQKEDKNV